MSAQATVQDLVTFERGDVRLLGRLYRPAGDGPFPALVEVHGGAWTSGDRTSNADIAQHLSGSGIAVFSLEFRMPPLARYPETVADVNLGIRWFKANAHLAATRSDLIGGLGTSSGGHLLLLAAFCPHDSRYTTHRLASDAAIDASLAYTIACWPVADPLARYRMAQSRGNERLVAAHQAFWPDEQAMDDANPVLLLERHAVGTPPPMLVVQGTNDANLPEGLAQRLVTAARGAGGDAEVLVYPDEPHSFIGSPHDPENARRALDAIVAFVRAQTPFDKDSAR
jgi:acetyl esterase